MAKIECKSAQKGIASVFVEIDGISDSEVRKARKRLDWHIEKSGEQVSTSVALAFLEAATNHQHVNPSDLWHHVIYRHLLDQGWSDARWKRVSGFALERVFVILYRNCWSV